MCRENATAVSMSPLHFIDNFCPHSHLGSAGKENILNFFILYLLLSQREIVYGFHRASYRWTICHRGRVGLLGKARLPPLLPHKQCDLSQYKDPQAPIFSILHQMD